MLRRIMLSMAIVTITTLALAGHYYYKGFFIPLHRTATTPSSSTVAEAERERIDTKAATLKIWLQQHHFNNELCFLVDMRIHSGKNRFFVYSLLKDSIIRAGLVAHGCGNANFSFTPSFSNVDGSNCSSLGKYRIGYPYQGQFGRSYKLYGLDATNDQAFSRNVVLHSYNAVPAGETYPLPICNSRGCPMVAPAFLQELQPVIDGSRKPILLYIFY